LNGLRGFKLSRIKENKEKQKETTERKQGMGNNRDVTEG
jgi:hypothetical protein